MKQILGRIAVGVALAGLFAAAPQASVDRSTYLTFNRAVALPGVTLAAGTYIFEAGVAFDPSVVRVLSRDRSMVLFTAFTHIVDRPRDLASDQHVTLGEAPRGEAAAIRVWYPVAQRTGRQFIYEQ